MKLKSLIILAVVLVTSIDAKADKLESMRTSKKIIRMSSAQSPSFAIQIIALKLPPQAPEFFHNVEVAREYPCSDGYYRFCVGEFSSYEDAKRAVDGVKSLGYEQAFVVNTTEYVLKGQASVIGSASTKMIDPNKEYTIQLSAFRFPVYLNHFKNIDDIMEFRMKDKIFRYTTGQFMGDVAEQELNKIKALGYKDAHLVELEKYLPFKIE
ncbi:SPOR domain-containing protein [Carboxylicivirga sp. M1479]|uniref:SPOR domain-containing protein n=1 Tax=Carboxylicivirga sp. M1479 TaxID=2594476 RepID=UPI001177D5AF|nr:SPOR domain-containing protein [Carboxylicivirga sp. M1479]TRX70333.1 SPOR domain-containing protein [Carboxylicivirga sp. M1479]